MYEIVILNKNGEKFSKTFASKYLFEKFLNKVRHSKTLTLVSHSRIF